jgi:Fe-S-cluster containining protein
MKQFIKNTIEKYFYKTKISFLYVCGKKYTRHGECKACGSCCKNISVKHGKNVIKTPEEFEQLQRKFPVYRMLRIMDNAQHGLVFQCVCLDDETGKCTDYNNRPPICRNYPHETIFKLGGNLADSCGFTFKPIKSFNSVLAEVQNKQ